MLLTFCSVTCALFNSLNHFLNEISNWIYIYITKFRQQITWCLAVPVELNPSFCLCFLILCCMGLLSHYYNAYHLSPLLLYFVLMEEEGGEAFQLLSFSN